MDGCRELALGNEDSVLNHLCKAIHLADGVYLAGFLAFKNELCAEAEQYFNAVYRNYRKLISIQRMDAARFRPADHIDPAYGEELRKAIQTGVEILVYDVVLDMEGIRLNQGLPWEI